MMYPSQPRTSLPLTLQGPRLGLSQLWTDVLQDVVVLLGLELLGEHKGFAAHLQRGPPLTVSRKAKTGDLMESTIIVALSHTYAPLP